MPPEEFDRYGPYGSGSAEGRLLNRLSPRMPEGYPEYATDAYYTPAIDRLFDPVYAGALDSADERPPIRKTTLERYPGHPGYVPIRNYDPATEYAPIGQNMLMDILDEDARTGRKLGQTFIKAPIVHYPISNRSRLVPQNMPDVYNTQQNYYNMGRQMVEDLVSRIMGRR